MLTGAQPALYTEIVKDRLPREWCCLQWAELSHGSWYIQPQTYTSQPDLDDRSLRLFLDDPRLCQADSANQYNVESPPLVGKSPAGILRTASVSGSCCYDSYLQTDALG